jgi:hypothetical protein
MSAESMATVEVELHFNLALLEYASQRVLERYNMDVSMFSAQELIEAWAKAVQHHLESWARDTDHFLASNGNEKAFLNTLLES